MKKTIRICSREWDLKFDPKHTGASFHTYGKPSSGKGVIILGTKWKEKGFKWSILIHEILEAILTTDGKRFERARYQDDMDYRFIFNHDYLEELPFKILDALESCGVINLKKKP